MLANSDEIFPTVKPQKQQRGRPRANSDPLRRSQHIGLALIYFGSNWTLARVAKMHDVSVDTARRWIRLALHYEDPESDRVRELARNYRRKIKYIDDLYLESH